ncbi:MAG: DUF445 domain-containing protein [Bacteroidetes bacterium]|nr:DUF445 family protein [Bacteroidia bacterium]PCH69749.1 MAG: DUF445 domain-containing protein [Bacteroidota bacterium]
MIYTLPIIAALIGWFTNYLAVKMLFHPRKPINLLVLKVQGIFPKRQKDLAEKLGKIVSEELISVNDLTESIQNPENITEVKSVIDQKIDRFLNEKLKEAVPMISMFMSEELLGKIKTSLRTEFESVLPEIIDVVSKKLDQNVNIEKIVYERVVEFSSSKLEQILFSIMKKEFKFIELVGAMLGFIIGLVQVLLINFI